MTKEISLRLLRQYQEVSENIQWATESLEILYGMADRFPSDGSRAKAMRWLGFAQGVLVSNRVYTLEQVKEHSKDGSL